MNQTNSIYREVRIILPATDIQMGEIKVKQSLPKQGIEQVDPFLLLHHARIQFDNTTLAKHLGVSPHPHRGFSPVTFVIKGEVHHQDSRGNNQVAKEGEVQWIHSGAGIIHSERPTQALVDKKGWQEIVQLWINTPAANKMKQPEYHYLSTTDMPVFSSDDQKVKSKLIAGNYNKLKGKINAQSNLLVIWGNGKKYGRESYQIPNGYNAMLYVIKGEIALKRYGLVEPENLVFFEKEGEKTELSVQEDAEFLLLCGDPINEEVTRSGPYVMNNTTEILEAMRDYKMGKMGVLIEEH